jgi:hypothetical protein
MPWYRANLHTHTTRSSDGKATPQEVCDWYHDRGYHVLGLTDHDHVAMASDYRAPNGLLVIQGVEVSGNHLLALGVSQGVDKRLPMQEKIDCVLRQGGLCIAAHPNWRFDHWPMELLESAQGYVALEIFNSHVSVMEGSGYAMDKWDRLLSQGRRVWGTASDDLHDLGSGLAGCGWVVISATDLSLSSVRSALIEGNFYASTGETLEEIEIGDGHMTVVARGAEEIVFSGRNGDVLERVRGNRATYNVRGDELYVRASCCGPLGAAFTQPTFISDWQTRRLPASG